ncbi:protransforming growth factor alpha [Tiliqua scincoides]|uniref:protransforming growth factor alpha n=1 Tax=Tiliqua scincoides TaxID=71010 RepID=UPI0034625003
MVSASAAEVALLALGVLSAVCHALENTTVALSALKGSISDVGEVCDVWKSQHVGSSLRLAIDQAIGPSTSASSGPPRAAAVRSHFDDCPDAHSHYCFHGTCRFLVQQAEPSCVCHSGFVGMRCEHADLLAVVAASQKKQTITALVVVSVIASVVLIVVCVLIHCCRIRKHCEGCRTFICRHEKPNGLLKGGSSCCHSETVV